MATTMSPTPKFPYRIQNMDFNTYLEMSVRPNNQPTSLRPWKDSDQQKWTFETDDGGDSYIIHNVAQKTYLGLKSDTDQRLVSKSKTSATKWVIYKSDASSDADIYEICLSGADTDSYLQLGEYGSVYITTDHNDTEAQQWRIFSGSPPTPIPKPPATLLAGYYRIRNLNGFAILTFPTASDSNVPVAYPNIFVSEQDSDNDRQRWYVKPTEKANTYTIQTAVSKGDYLGAQDGQLVRLGTVQGLSDTAFSWEFENIGGFAYSINVKGASVKKRFAVGFGSYQADIGNQVVLMPSCNAFSQVWLFEAWEKLSPGPYPAPYYSPDYALIRRDNGWYNICSYASSSYYLYMNGVYGAPHLFSVQASYFKTYASFYITVKGQLFQIKDRGGWFAMTSGTVLSYTTTESSGSWWYLKRDTTTSAYYICLYEAGSSGPAKALGNNGTSYYVSGSGYVYYSLPISQLSVGSTSQMWTFQ